jgi:hypothetical protein
MKSGLLPMVVILLIAGGAAHAQYPANSIGPAYIAEDLFGINYERSISPWFSIDVLAATAGRLDFGGVRLVLSRDEPSFQFRPSLGMCVIRGEYDEGDDAGEHSPWFGFIWPGIGINYRSGRISGTLDLGAIYGNTGEDDETYAVLSTSVMYMF